MAAKDLADAVRRVAKPPCEKGCDKIQWCKRHPIACGLFLNYVSGARKLKTTVLPNPSRGVYDTIYHRGAE